MKGPTMISFFKFLTSKFNIRSILIVLLSALGFTFLGCELEPGKSSTDETPPPSENLVNQRLKPQTFVDGTDVGGMALSDAVKLIEPTIAERAASYRCVLHGDESNAVGIELTQNEVPIENDLEAVLTRALTDGAGNYEVRLNYNEAMLNTWVNELAQTLYFSPAAHELEVIIEHEKAANEGRFKLLPPKDGKRLDTETLIELINNGQTEIALPMIAIKYDGGADGTPEELLPKLLSSFATSFSIWSEGDSNRAFNIEKAANLINGHRTAPGDSFSCNEILGERSEENGWKPATAFINGGKDTEDQFGGGICQVSSTLYNAILRTELEVQSRCGHSRRVNYVPGGTDAAISGESLDFVWRNNTDSDVYVFMWIENETELHCEIYGQLDDRDFDYIDVESVLCETIPPSEPEFTSNPELPLGACELVEAAAEGKVFETYKVYYRDGKEVLRKTVGKTEYRMRPAVYAVGSGG